jgi:hypothetical protein
LGGGIDGKLSLFDIDVVSDFPFLIVWVRRWVTDEEGCSDGAGEGDVNMNGVNAETDLIEMIFHLEFEYILA